MKLAKRIFTIAALSIVVLVIIISILFHLVGENLIKTGIETAGTKALNVGVKIEDLNLSILKGTVSIKGLQVRNPEGYNHQNMLVLTRGRVRTKLGSLLSDTVHIREVRLEDVNVVLEQKGLTNNIQQILKNMPSKEQKQPSSSAKKLQIDMLELTNIKVQAKLLPLPGKKDTVNLNLGDIKMTNLGGDNKLTAVMLTKQIILKITQAITKAGKGILPKDILSSMENTLGGIMKAGKGIGEKTKVEANKILDKGKDVGSAVTEGLKGLLKQTNKAEEQSK